MMNRAMLAAIGLGLFVGASPAQVLLPPAEKPEGFNTTPPPPDPTREELMEALRKRNMEKMREHELRDRQRELEDQRRQQRINEEEARRQLAAELADVQYESMVWRDENGAVIPLDQPASFAAFSHNPLMDATTLEMVWAVVGDRRARLQQRLIEHPEVVQLIAAGEIERATVSDINELQRLRLLLEKLNLETGLLQELGQRGVIDQRQAYMNSVIEREYLNALRTERTAGLERMEMLEKLLPLTLRGQASEPLFVYEEMLIGAAPRLEEIGSRLELTEVQQELLRETLAKLGGAGDRSERIEIMNGFVSGLEPDQIRAFLTLAAG